MRTLVIQKIFLNNVIRLATEQQIIDQDRKSRFTKLSTRVHLCPLYPSTTDTNWYDII